MAFLQYFRFARVLHENAHQRSYDAKGCSYFLLPHFAHSCTVRCFFVPSKQNYYVTLTLYALLLFTVHFLPSRNNASERTEGILFIARSHERSRLPPESAIV
jgi:hypothetical protein